VTRKESENQKKKRKKGEKGHRAGFVRGKSIEKKSEKKSVVETAADVSRAGGERWKKKGETRGKPKKRRA